VGTFLFEDIIFGPVRSRRLGASLGINLLPQNRKVCNFNCIYCECGWTNEPSDSDTKLPSRGEIRIHLEERLSEIRDSNEELDTITYAGNGEPTIHPEFSGIIEDTINLRDKLFPQVKIAVLSNATLIHRQEVFNALGKIELNILKLDSVFPETLKFLNRHLSNYSLEKTIEGLMKFNGNFILQTMFIQGSFEGVVLDNSSEKEVQAWLQVVNKLRPARVMVYTIARNTPVSTLKKLDPSRLDAIATEVRNLGIPVDVSY